MLQFYHCHPMAYPRDPVKKYKYGKFSKLKARFFSLYAGFPPLLRMTYNTIRVYRRYFMIWESNKR